MSTKERLAHDLEAAGLPDMARVARTGYYDDYESSLDRPIHQLVADLIKHGRKDLAARARNGEWDATKEEGEAWVATPNPGATVIFLDAGFEMGGLSEGAQGAPR